MNYVKDSTIRKLKEDLVSDLTIIEMAFLIEQVKKVERYEKAMKEAIDCINREAFRTACNELEKELT